jgi:hypothetical protein
MNAPEPIRFTPERKQPLLCEIVLAISGYQLRPARHVAMFSRVLAEVALCTSGLRALDGQDTLRGNFGNDELTGGVDADDMRGGTGDDRLLDRTRAMDLDFWPGAVVLMFIAALTAVLVTAGGRSAWFLGLPFLFVHAIFPAMLYVVPPLP